MIINLTGQTVRLYGADRPDGVDDLDQGLLRTIDPDPQPAQLTPLELVTATQDDVPVELIEYGHVASLPTARDGYWYVVPLEVALAVTPRRTDVLVTHLDVLNSAGAVIGCRSLAQPV